jgi:prepilin-type N-terminal cleavage/methylation domain-containing protein
VNNKGFTLIELMIVVVIIGILAAIAIPNFIAMQDRAKEARVKSAAHTVQLSAEDWAVRNDGIYGTLANVQGMLPDTDGDGNPDLLDNPFTGAAAEPSIAGQAANPGQVGYATIVQNAVNVGYTVTGYGKDANSGDAGIVISLTSGS